MDFNGLYSKEVESFHFCSVVRSVVDVPCGVKDTDEQSTHNVCSSSYPLYTQRSTGENPVSTTTLTTPSPYSHRHVPRSSCSRVQFLNLKQVYLKAQSRVGRESKQRLIDARVRMVVTFTAQIERILVFVERSPEAASLCRDLTGRVPLKIKMGDLMLNKQYFSVDLDSVYLSPLGIPVYKLSTVDADKRNRFRVVVIVVCIDDVKSRPYFSRPFLIRSRRPSSGQDSV